MKIFTLKNIEKLAIQDKQFIQWVKQAFLMKSDSLLPHKISQTFNEGRNFYNTMPAIIPKIDAAGVKIVSRYPERTPSIKGDLLLYRFSDGEALALMDATLITAKRTGAVAALAVETFAKKDFETIAVVGLGQAGRCFLDMFLTNPAHLNKKIKLKSYKNQAQEVKQQLLAKGATQIEIFEHYEDFIKDSDVIVSALTVAEHELGQDNWFKEGCLVVPIHTRGFQNCDITFDKVFADDTAHVEGFKHFNEFKQFNEIDQVLKGLVAGRENQREKILSYNIGIALHDIYVAKKIYDRAKNDSAYINKQSK